MNVPERTQARLQQLGEILSGRRRVLVLTHHNPDPDALGAAYGFAHLLQQTFGIHAVIRYSGMVSLAENREMVRRLRIPARVADLRAIRRYATVALVDSQPGTGNNILPKLTPPTIVIDHHPVRKASYKSRFHDLRPEYGSTSTIICEYLLAAGLTPKPKLATALLYGIKTDTLDLARSATQADVAMHRWLLSISDLKALAQIRRTRVSRDYFRTISSALGTAFVCGRVVICHAGELSERDHVARLADDLSRLRGTSWTFVTGTWRGQLAMSLRTNGPSGRAGDILRKAVGPMGAAGGHGGLAGGSMPLSGRPAAEAEAIRGDLVARLLHLLKSDTKPRVPLLTTPI